MSRVAIEPARVDERGKKVLVGNTCEKEPLVIGILEFICFIFHNFIFR